MSLFISLIAVGCSGPRYVDYFPYHDDGTAKPRVALLPMIDGSNCQVPWNIADELTQGVKYRMMNNGDIYLLSDKEMGPDVHNLNETELFSPDMSYAKKICNADFVVATELVEHKVLPYERGKTPSPYPTQGFVCNYVLNMKVRIKVMDIRCERPSVILQEIFVSNHLVPKERDVADYNQDRWGTPGYSGTLYGRAHQLLTRDLAQRIEDVTWGAR